MLSLITLFFSPQVKAQQTVDNGQATQAIPMPGNGCSYRWEVIDNPQIGFPSTSGTGDIPAFTAVNNSTKSVTAHIRLTPMSEGYAYIANNGADNVTVINTTTRNIVTHIPVDSRPYGVAVSPDGRRVYVVNTKDADSRARPGTVSVIDATTNTVIGGYTVEEIAAAIAVNPNGKAAYVVNEKSGSVSVLDLSKDNTVTVTISVPAAFAIGVSPDGSRVYVATKTGKLYTVDASNNRILGTVPISTNSPLTLVVSADGSKIYIGNIGVNYICVVDAVTGVEQKVTVNGMSPLSMAITPEGDKLYLSTSNGVTILNTSDNSVLKDIPLPTTQQRYGVSVSPNGKEVYLVAQNPNQIEVINTATDELEAPIANDMAGALSVGNFVSAGIGCSTTPITYTIKVNAEPHIDDPGGVVVPSTHYGTASTAPIINVSGSSLKGAITVTAPVGFELSTDDINFKDAVTVGAAGDVSGVGIFVRLKATAPVKAYQDYILIGSPGAQTVKVLIQSTMLTTQLNITADNKVKFFGDALPVLTVTYAGFVNGEGPSQLTTQPNITTTATATSPLGEYPITASGASAKNYVITYAPGKLQIVTGDVSLTNAFTPNGDGINDTWEIKNLNLYTGCTVEILNRYGQKVYYTTGYPKPWNGTMNGQALPVGVYYYIIRLKPGAKPLTGPLTIIR